MDISGSSSRVICLSVAILLSGCWASEPKFSALHPAFPRHETQQIKIETIYRTIVKSEKATRTEYPTCTAVASDIGPCMYLKVARTQRALFPVTSERVHPKGAFPHHAIRLFEIIREQDRLDEEKQKQQLESSLSEDLDGENRDILLRQEVIANNNITPELRLIIFRTTTTETRTELIIETNTNTMVGITYNGCIPTDAPSTTACPTLP